MPMKPKTYRKKRARAPRRKGRRRTGLAIPNTVKSDFNCIQRDLKEQTFENDATLETKFSKQFSLSAIQNYTDYTAIWDQYRINMIKMEFIPVLTEVVNRPFDDTTTPGTTGQIPNYCVSIDRDDGAAETYDELRARQYSFIRKATKPLVLKFKPNRLMATYNTAVTTGYTVDNTKKFLDCAYPQIPHWGIKFAMEAASPSDTYRIQTRITYFMSYAQRRN